jgi:putative transposon-encoded protein
MEKGTKKKEGNFSLMNILDGKISFREKEEVLQREVKKFGSGSAHVLIPKKHIGKIAEITIWKEEKKEEDSKNK